MKTKVTRGDLVRAKIKSTGQQVEVYPHNDGSFVNFSDCVTKYQSHELENMEPV